MIRRNYPGDRNKPFRQSAPGPRRPPQNNRPPRPKEVDSSATGSESSYLLSLMEKTTELMVVLKQGDQIEGRLVWYDQGCLKIAPSDGAPSLLILKHNIKYLYEVSQARS
jgi:sRNA-binding regulator protein Hfq